MPWKAGDAVDHTGKADTPKRKRMWMEIANQALKDGHSDASAIRMANAAVARDHGNEHVRHR
jgi:uncharacterized protein YdaT